MMPQAIAAMSLKLTMPRILARFGYRAVLISNTMIIGLLILLFATIGQGTPVWLIVIEVFCYGFFTSLQYTSMNTLVYADVSPRRRKARQLDREHRAADADQFRRRVGFAGDGVLPPDRYRSNPAQFIRGIHQAFFVLGGMTLLSTAVFRGIEEQRR